MTELIPYSIPPQGIVCQTLDYVDPAVGPIASLGKLYLTYKHFQSNHSWSKNDSDTLNSLLNNTEVRKAPDDSGIPYISSNSEKLKLILSTINTILADPVVKKALDDFGIPYISSNSEELKLIFNKISNILDNPYLALENEVIDNTSKVVHKSIEYFCGSQYQRKKREISIKLIQLIYDGRKLEIESETGVYVWLRKHFLNLKLVINQFFQGGEKQIACYDPSPYTLLSDNFEETYDSLAQLKTSPEFDAAASSILKSFFQAEKFSGFESIKDHFSILPKKIELKDISVTETQERTILLWTKFFDDLTNIHKFSSSSL